MRTRIVTIGNSRSVRIPQRLLEQTGLRGEVDISAQAGIIIIRSPGSPRVGWAEAFRKLNKNGDDALLDDPLPPISRFDKDEWEW